jgi:hypothetical protein
MTLNAQEVFVTQIARAGAAQADKFLRVRGIQKADRDDIIAAALLWCWENQAKYDPLIAQLDMWFIRAVRNAWESWRANELPTSAVSVDSIGGGDETYDIVAAESAASAIIRELKPVERRIAILTMQGYTKSEIMEEGISRHEIREAREFIKRLRELLPDKADYSFVIRTPSAEMSDDVTATGFSGLDKALFAALDFPPHHGKDCPPCWRCMWFEGFMPSGKLSVRLVIKDDEVRAAVEATEARKIEIAQQIRDGVL